MTGRGGTSGIMAAPAIVAPWRLVNQCPDVPTEAALPSTGDATTSESITHSPCTAGAAVVFMKVEGGGHTWPGAPEVLPAHAVGAPSHPFDVSESARQFFDTHPR